MLNRNLLLILLSNRCIFEHHFANAGSREPRMCSRSEAAHATQRAWGVCTGVVCLPDLLSTLRLLNRNYFVTCIDFDQFISFRIIISSNFLILSKQLISSLWGFLASAQPWEGLQWVARGQKWSDRPRLQYVTQVFRLPNLRDLRSPWLECDRLRPLQVL